MLSPPTLSVRAHHSSRHHGRNNRPLRSRASAFSLGVDEALFGRNKPVNAVIRLEDIDLVKPEVAHVKAWSPHLLIFAMHYEMKYGPITTEYGTVTICSCRNRVGIKVDPFDIQTETWSLKMEYVTIENKTYRTQVLLAESFGPFWSVSLSSFLSMSFTMG